MDLNNLSPILNMLGGGGGSGMPLLGLLQGLGGNKNNSSEQNKSAPQEQEHKANETGISPEQKVQGREKVEYISKFNINNKLGEYKYENQNTQQNSNQNSTTTDTQNGGADQSNLLNTLMGALGNNGGGGGDNSNMLQSLLGKFGGNGTDILKMFGGNKKNPTQKQSDNKTNTQSESSYIDRLKKI